MGVGENLKEFCLRAAGRPVAVELKQVLKGVLFEIHVINISIIAIRQAANKSGTHI